MQGVFVVQNALGKGMGAQENALHGCRRAWASANEAPANVVDLGKASGRRHALANRRQTPPAQTPTTVITTYRFIQGTPLAFP